MLFLDPRRAIIRLIDFSMGLPFSSSQLSRWGRVLALALVVVVTGQGMPLQSIVHSLQHDAAHHQCDHSDGICPMNPNGPCTCDHSSDESTDGPALQSCSSSQASAVAATLSRWIPWSRVQGPAPQMHVQSQAAVYTIRSSQRMGDEIFHPPRWASLSPA